MEVFLHPYGASADKSFSVLLHPCPKDLLRAYLTESGTDVVRDDARLMRDGLEQADVRVRYDLHTGSVVG